MCSGKSHDWVWISRLTRGGVRQKFFYLWNWWKPLSGMQEYKNLSWVWGADRKITRLCRVMPNSDPEWRIFLSAPNNHDRFFFLHTLWATAFDFYAINELRSYTLTSAILKVDVICDVTMMSTPNVLTTGLRGLLYNQCIDDTCRYSFFIYPKGQIRVCKIIRIFKSCEVLIENSITRVTVRRSGKPRVAKHLPERRNFQFAPKNHYGFVFLHTLPSTIAFRLEYVLFYQFYAKIATFFGQIPKT